MISFQNGHGHTTILNVDVVLFFSTMVWIFFLIMVYMTVYPKIMRKGSSLIIGEYRHSDPCIIVQFSYNQAVAVGMNEDLIYIRLLIIRNSCRTIYTKALRQNLVDGLSTQISRRNTVLQPNQNTIPCNNSYIYILESNFIFNTEIYDDESNLNECNEYFTLL